MVVSNGNSTTTSLTGSATFTGDWEIIHGQGSISMIYSADVAGTLYAEFSTNGTDTNRSLKLNDSADSTPSGIHLLAVVAKYFRVRFVNGSDAQSSFYIQTLYGIEPKIALPTGRLGATSNNYSDVLNIRSNNEYHNSVALGKHTGISTWNKFGNNLDVDVGTEVVANFGGSFSPLTTASTLRFVSSSTDDDDGGIGANSLVVWGVDANRDAVIEVVTLNGTSNVDTTSTWLGINRVSLNLSGSSKGNVGNITITDVTSGATQAYLTATEGTTQQLIYFTPNNSTSLIKWILLKGNKISGGDPIINFKIWVYSAISNSNYDIFEYNMNTGVENHIDLHLPEPLIVSEQSCIWVEATSDKANAIVAGRFSLTENADF